MCSKPHMVLKRYVFVIPVGYLVGAASIERTGWRGSLVRIYVCVAEAERALIWNEMIRRFSWVLHFSSLHFINSSFKFSFHIHISRNITTVYGLCKRAIMLNTDSKLWNIIKLQDLAIIFSCVYKKLHSGGRSVSVGSPDNSVKWRHGNIALESHLP